MRAAAASTDGAAMAADIAYPPWRRPRAAGTPSRVSTAPPPADCPATVTRSASPPNAAMFCRTHSSARTQSSTPRFAGAPSSQPKPVKPRRYEKVTSPTPSRAKARPSYQGLAGEPEMNPPPWIQTTTGSRAAAPGSGVQTLTFSVLSPGTECSGISVMPASPRWGVGPKRAASRTPSQAAGGCGAANRRSPTGAAA